VCINGTRVIAAAVTGTLRRVTMGSVI